MSLAPQKFREITLQALYSLDMGSNDDERLAKLLMVEYSIGRKPAREAIAKARAVHSAHPQLDPKIAAASSSYAFDRIQAIERNILRLGVYELCHEDDLPSNIVFAEALRLAKKFGTPEAARFVHAVLDTVFRKEQGETIEEETLQSSIEALEESEQLAAQAHQEQEQPDHEK